MSVSMQTPEQLAMSAATGAVKKVLATAKNPRTILGKRGPAGIAYAAAVVAIETYTETLTHERARNAGAACGQCGQFPKEASGE